MAILFAICTCPRNSNIQIHTDSQSIITKFSKITSNSIPTHKQYFYSYWPIWHSLLNLIQSYQYTVTFHKVPTYSNNTFNNKANKLATNYNFTAYLDLIYNN